MPINYARKIKGQTQGFTLLDLMVTIAIIAILAAIAIPKYISFQERALLVEGKLLIANMRTAVFSVKLSKELDGNYTPPTMGEILEELGMLYVYNSPGSITVAWEPGILFHLANLNLNPIGTAHAQSIFPLFELNQICSIDSLETKKGGIYRGLWNCAEPLASRCGLVCRSWT